MENPTAKPVSSEPTERPEPVPEPVVGPPWYGRWMLFLVLFGTYFVVQLLVAIPFVVWLVASQRKLDTTTLVESPLVIWATLIGSFLAAIATGLVAWSWAGIWRFLTSQDNFSPSLWLAWNAVKRIPLWLVSLITIPLVFVVSGVVQSAVGPSEVELQQQLFTSPARQIFASIVVSTVVPLAEELIFRGALYSALMRRTMLANPSLIDHVLPLLVTTPLFAVIHVLGGFTTLPPFIAIGILSLFLGVIRAVTGSVKASIVGHMTWNLIGAIFITLSFYFPQMLR